MKKCKSCVRGLDGVAVIWKGVLSFHLVHSCDARTAIGVDLGWETRTDGARVGGGTGMGGHFLLRE